MQIEIYADIVFIINFIMIFIILSVVKIISKVKTSVKRLAVVSFSASFVYCLLLIFSNAGFFSALSLIILSVYFCFKPANIKELIKLTFFLIIVSFTLGGSAMCFFYYTKTGFYIGKALNLSVRNFSFKLLAVSTLLCYVIIRIVLKLIIKASIKKQCIYPLKLTFRDGTAMLNALVDTGNSLHEPISGKEVIIAEFDAIKDFLPDKLRILFYEEKSESISAVISALEQCENKEDYILIPFSSLGIKKGFILAVKTPFAEINTEQRIGLKNVYTAVFSRRLCPHGGFNSIISPTVLEHKEV